MTLLDFCRLLKRYLALVIILPLVCALGCFAYFSFAKTNEITYTATSRIVVTTHLQDVNGLTSSIARTAMESNKGITIKATMDSNTKTVSIAAAGADKQQAIDVANEVAETACKQSAEFVGTNAEDPFNARVEKASNASASSSCGDMTKYILAALLAGLFIAICIVLIIDMLKRPVKSAEGIQQAVDLPVLEVMPVKDDGERLLANARFASKNDDLRNVCIVPVGDGPINEAVAEAFVSAAKKEGLDARCESSFVDDDVFVTIACESLSHGMRAAYVARKAEATVLVVRQWADSMSALESAVAELNLAEANLIGVIFAKNAN